MMNDREEPVLLDLIIDEPRGLNPVSKRPVGRGLWPMRAAFLLVHLAMLSGFVAWAQGRLPWPIPNPVAVAPSEPVR